MKNRFVIVVGIVLGAVGLSAVAVVAQGPQQGSQPLAPAATELNLGTGFTYQGQLKNGGLGVTGNCDFLFALYDAQTLGARVGATQTVPSQAVAGGLFTTLLDFGQGAFDGSARFLNIQARCPAGSGGYTALNPRQPLTPVPYALALPGVHTEQGVSTTNIIAGAVGNRVQNNAIGATIGGGGSFYTNSVGAAFGTVGGGENNHVLGEYSTVAGGAGSYVSGYGSTAGGGYIISVQGDYGTIGGGQQNYISPNAGFGTIGGGAGNSVYGLAGTVPGGIGNSAKGDYSFAAGLNAAANYSGTFAWADTSDPFGQYETTLPNQFAIRATNGLSLALNAGYTKTVKLGERYRDNAIVAWAKIDGPTGLVQNTGKSSAFGIADTVHLSTGEYGITTTASADNSFDLIPIAIAEIDGVPINAAGMRVVAINQISPNYFEVYVNSGTGTLTDNDFVVMVTAR